MLDLDHLRRIRLSATPPASLALTGMVLRASSALRGRTRVVIEGLEHVPRARPVFLAMNEIGSDGAPGPLGRSLITLGDAWPLRSALVRAGLPYTAAWVRARRYDTRVLGALLDRGNHIPLPSRGFVLAHEVQSVARRPAREDEVAALRDLIEGRARADEAAARGGPAVAALIARDGAASGFRARFDSWFAAMMGEVARLTRAAMLELGLHVLVFPQARKAAHVSHGHAGMMQMAQHLGVSIVPVGCGVSVRHELVYCIGQALHLEAKELVRHRVHKPFVPFSHAAVAEHGPRFEAATEVVLAAIARLQTDAERRAAA